MPDCPDGADSDRRDEQRGRTQGAKPAAPDPEPDGDDDAEKSAAHAADEDRPAVDDGIGIGFWLDGHRFESRYPLRAWCAKRGCYRPQPVGHDGLLAGISPLLMTYACAMKRSRKFGISLFVACACMVAPVQSALAGALASTNRESTVDEDEHFFGGPLDSDDMAVVAALTAAQMDAIDAAVLLDVPARWAKVAMVLGKQLKSRPGIPDDVPLEYYWQRLSRLVDQGRVEVQGDLRRARYSEVRRH